MNTREFWELQMPLRSDKEDLLRCMRIAKIDSKVISDVLADDLTEDQKKQIEESDTTTDEFFEEKLIRQ